MSLDTLLDQLEGKEKLTCAECVRRCRRDGVRLFLTQTGTVKMRGEQSVIDRWLPVIREHKPAVIALLGEELNYLRATEPKGEA